MVSDDELANNRFYKLLPEDFDCLSRRELGELLIYVRSTMMSSLHGIEKMCEGHNTGVLYTDLVDDVKFNADQVISNINNYNSRAITLIIELGELGFRLMQDELEDDSPQDNN